MAAQIGDKLQNEWKSNATEWARCSGGGAPYSPSLCPDEWGPRTFPQDYLEEQIELARLGSPAVSGFAATSLRWIRVHEPEALERARYALQPKDWLRARLGGMVATEPSDAHVASMCASFLMAHTAPPPSA